MVMATGIVAIAAAQQDIGWLADASTSIAAAAYVVLVVLTLLRLVRFRRLLVADLTSHAKGFAFLTTVAATNVLGSASPLSTAGGTWPGSSGGSASGSGRCLLYTTLIAVVLRARSPASAPASTARGSCSPSPPSPSPCSAPSCSPATPATARLRLHRRLPARDRALPDRHDHGVPALDLPGARADEADPPAWIAAGAVAITVLAGSNLLGAAPASLRIDRLAPSSRAWSCWLGPRPRSGSR